MPYVVIAGGTGLIGQALSDHLSSIGYTVYVYTRHLPPRVRQSSVTAYYDRLSAIPHPVDGIINLSGVGLNTQRWSESFKADILESRIAATEDILDYLQACDIKPSWHLNASAIGYYGQGNSESVYTENSVTDDTSFNATLCRDWEKTARHAEVWGIRVALLRFGVVLSTKGGALHTMLKPFRFGLGAVLGSGKQWTSWIHIDDLVHAVAFIIQHDTLKGPINLVSPQTVTHRDFCLTLANALKRPLLLTLPSWLVRIIFGEIADHLLLHGPHVMPEKLQQAAFTFKHAHLAEALSDLLKKPKA
jgi:uncharacterized protein (TIGR01777 family)